MAEETPEFMVEGARIIFRNFEGKEGQYNREGDRNFGLVLPPDEADRLSAEGWNVKILPSREDGEPDTPWLPVEVKYKFRPPRVIIISNGGKTRTQLTEDTVAMVDMVDIENVDLICRPHHWGPINGKYGIKAYLQTMYVTIHEDALERKYNNMPVTSGADD